MQISKYIKLDVNVLLEYIYDDSNYLEKDYAISTNTLDNSIIYKNDNNQLFLLNSSNKKWGFLDNKFSYIQSSDYSGNVPTRFDTVRLHFPINYDFSNYIGCLLNINVVSTTRNYTLNNYFYDKTDPTRTDINFNPNPFLMNEQLWGKYIDISIPSTYGMLNDVDIINKTKSPRIGTVHYNLVKGNDIISDETVISFGYSFINSKETIDNKKSYYISNTFTTSLPYTPEFENVSVAISHSKQGDYYEISGVFNSSIDEFSNFINMQNNLGKSTYITYDVNVYEKNTLSDKTSLYQTENFDIPITYRPVIKYSSTYAYIVVTMNMINQADGSVVTRECTYVLTQQETSKYSRFLTKINMSNAIKPKIYNSKASDVIINNIGSNNTTTIQAPFAVLYEKVNISVKQITEISNGTPYYGQGQMQLLIYPSDNLFVFNVVSNVGATITPYTIPSEGSVYLRFKSNKTVIEYPVYTLSDKNDLNNGIVSFNILETDYTNLYTMYSQGYDQFYIIVKSSQAVTTLYSGRYLPYQKI
jgi:hypothetical protein